MLLFAGGLRCLGHTVDVACPKRKAGEKVKTAIHDFEGDQTYTYTARPPAHAHSLSLALRSPCALLLCVWRDDSEKPGHLFALTVDWDALVADHSGYVHSSS
jgi:hypothetical protein